MNLYELFGSRDQEAIIQSIARLMEKWRGVLRLAHSREAHEDNKDHYRMVDQELEGLLQQHLAGEDVTDRLLEIEKEVRERVRTIP